MTSSVSLTPGISIKATMCKRATDQPIALMSARDCWSKVRNCRRSSKASLVNRPCLSAFLLPGGAPDPGAPPCIRQRILPRTAGDIQGFPERVLAPQRGLCSIGPVLRSWLTMAAPRRLTGASPQQCVCLQPRLQSGANRPLTPDARDFRVSYHQRARCCC